jgi:hypothetical protein
MKRKHVFTITVMFDKPCSEGWARREVADCIHGEFYPTQRDDSEPGTFRVNRFGRLKNQDRQ